MANWGWGSLVDLLKLGAGVGLAATGFGMPAAAAMLPAGFIGPPVAAGLSAAAAGTIAGGASMGLSGAEGLAGSASAPSDEEIANAQPKRTGFMPQPSRFSAANREPGPMARYAPQNRQPQSGLDPEIMSYLMRYMRPR